MLGRNYVTVTLCVLIADVIALRQSMSPAPPRIRTTLQKELAATLRWFTAGDAIRIALRQLSQTWKLRYYDVIDDVITRKL